MDGRGAGGPYRGMGDEVYLHAGSPRTGTSSFQLFLERNADAIRAQGIDPAWPGRDAARAGRLALRLPAPRHRPEDLARRRAKARDGLAGLIGAGRPALISEENIPGRMLEIYGGQFFPIARARADYLAGVLAPRRVARITLVLRPYADMIVSGFRKRAEDNWQREFRHYRERMSRFEGGWPEVVAALQAGLAPGEVVVLPYRRRPAAALLAAVCPLIETAAMVEPAGEANVSLSDAALFALRARYGAGEAYTPALVAAVRTEFADVAAERPFARFSAAQKARLDARFEADLDRLAAMVGVVVKREG